MNGDMPNMVADPAGFIPDKLETLSRQYGVGWVDAVGARGKVDLAEALGHDEHRLLCGRVASLSHSGYYMEDMRESVARNLNLTDGADLTRLVDAVKGSAELLDYEMETRGMIDGNFFPPTALGQNMDLRVATATHMGIELDADGAVPGGEEGYRKATSAFFYGDDVPRVSNRHLSTKVFDDAGSMMDKPSVLDGLRSRFIRGDRGVDRGRDDGSLVEKPKTGMSMSDYGVGMAGSADPFTSPSVGADWGGSGVRGGGFGAASSGMVAQEGVTWDPPEQKGRQGPEYPYMGPG